MTRDEEIRKLVEQFAEATAGQTDCIRRLEPGKGNMLAKRRSAAFARLRCWGDSGRNALMPLLRHPRPDVRTMAAVYLLRHSTKAALEVLDGEAKGVGLTALGASEAIKRWNEGAWNLDPVDDPPPDPASNQSTRASNSARASLSGTASKINPKVPNADNTNIQVSNSHKVLPDASAFAEILDQGLTARSIYDGQPLQITAVELPPLMVVSGRIVASDGYILDRVPFVHPVPPGRHSVTLAIATIGDDERVAFAQVRFSRAAVTKWSLAITEGQDIASLQSGEVFGYPVDSGTGCFADLEAYRMVAKEFDSVQDRMTSEARKVYRHTRDWVSVATLKGSMAIFSSGDGDGLYPSYFGIDEKGNPVCLVTDFYVAEWIGGARERE